MIRGHIDLVTATRVEGWVYSPDVTMRGRRVYAYIDRICVGGGLVEVFREDLAGAGLGDGFLGFGFDIHLEQPRPLGRLVVTFEACDFVLPCAGAQLRGDDEILDQRVDYDDERSLWRFMFERGWITEGEYRPLHELARFGCYPLQIGPAAGDDDPEALAGQVATSLLRLAALRPCNVAEQSSLEPDEIRERIGMLGRAGGSRPPLCALWSPRVCWLRVAEGSHRLVSLGQRHDARDGMIEYAFGEKALLLLNARSEFMPLWEAQTLPVILWHVAIAE